MGILNEAAKYLLVALADTNERITPAKYTPRTKKKVVMF
jgi:hypothetical protein